MKYVAAYLLSDLAGTKNPSVAEISKILKSVGIEVDDTRAQKLISELSGKNLEEVMAQGSSKLSSVPMGGGALMAAGGAAVTAVAAAPGALAAVAVKKEEAKPAKKEEKPAEEEEDMGFGIFD
jgi:large subunit ribosomal protein LP2